MITIENIKEKIKKEEELPLVEKSLNFFQENYPDDIYNNDLSAFLNSFFQFNPDGITIASSILTYIKLPLHIIKHEFGENIYTIASTVYEIDKYSFTNKESELKNCLNSLNVDSPEDVRALLISLANRYYYIQTMGDLPTDIKKAFISEILNAFIPVAGKMRLGFIKSRLEDLCLQNLDPEAYNDILNKLNATPSQLITYLNCTKESISNLLRQNNINFTIKGRVKNIFSIYNKLANGKKWDEIYDISAIRIIVENEDECYKALELIYSLYTPVADRFKDYINNPKENMYQSLHTTIIDPDGRYYEIQIRTNQMNIVAEIGSAAHNEYKKEQSLKRTIPTIKQKDVEE